METRLLTPDDALAYTIIRRQMLADSPWAFAASPHDDRGLDPTSVALTLGERGQAICGAFETDGAIVSVAGVHLPRHIKMAHRAHVWGVYTTPKARRRGLAGEVLGRLFEVAASWPGVNSVGLSASVRSPDAIALYRRLGFKEWGTEPGALMLDGIAYDEIHMVKFLSPSTPMR